MSHPGDGGQLVDFLQWTSALGTRVWQGLFNAIHQEWVDDFLSTLAASVLNWTSTIAGAGATVANSTAEVTAVHPGVKGLVTGTTATGRAALSQLLLNYQLGSKVIEIETIVKVSALSTAAERYEAIWGLSDTFAAAAVANSVTFEYIEATSPNWLARTRAAAVLTSVDTGIPIVANTWVTLRIQVAGTGRASYFINDVAVTGIITNIPTTAVLAFGWRMLKTVGITSRTFFLDYFCLRTRFTAARS